MNENQLVWFCRMMKATMHPDPSSADPFCHIFVTFTHDNNGNGTVVDARCQNNTTSVRLADLSIDQIKSILRRELHGWYQDLIVADASILPIISDGNTQAPAYLIGYTVAELLKDD